MDSISTSTLFSILAVLLLLSGFFSASETAMMAINRYRLKHQAEQGFRGARLTLALLSQTDKLLGVILLGNNLVNTGAATLSTLIAIRLFGQGEIILFAATSLLTFFILVFSEVTPKVIGASYPERIAYPASFVLTPLLRLAYPLVWFVNLFVQGLLKLLRIKPRQDEGGNMLGLEELRTVVLESAKLLPREHRRILLNILGLESITVDDVMTPRNQIETIDLADEPEKISRQIATSHHTRLLVYEDSLDRITGILHVRRILHAMASDEFTHEAVREILQEPYFVPAGTPLFKQLRQFQENQKRLALVVDEYGELQGLVTMEDLLEEMVGEFTTQAPAQTGWLRQMEDGSWLVEGSALVRHVNRKLGLDFPLDGPKTLNGLLLEYLEDIPEAGVSVKIGNIPIEIVQTQDRAVKVARIGALAAPAAGDAGPYP
ncbi:HlyC/CorC family transporter [Betaproteobacteria bacterium SCN2]|nr:HlyC/CorC family transporter [Betaproteobacteria bacterium SCN2]